MVQTTSPFPTETSAGIGATGGSIPTGHHDVDGGVGTHDARPAQGEFGAFLDDVSELLRGSAGSGDLREMLDARIAQARDTLEQAVGQAQEASAAIQARARESVNRTLETSRTAVVERPLSSVALAAVAGLVVGLLIGGRR